MKVKFSVGDLIEPKEEYMEAHEGVVGHILRIDAVHDVKYQWRYDVTAFFTDDSVARTSTISMKTAHRVYCLTPECALKKVIDELEKA